MCWLENLKAYNLSDMIIGLLFSPSYKLAGRDQTHLGPGIRYTCFGDPWFILCGGTLDRPNRAFPFTTQWRGLLSRNNYCQSKLMFFVHMCFSTARLICHPSLIIAKFIISDLLLYGQVFQRKWYNSTRFSCVISQTRHSFSTFVWAQDFGTLITFI